MVLAVWAEHEPISHCYAVQEVLSSRSRNNLFISDAILHGALAEKSYVN